MATGYRVSRTIKAPAETVWRLLTDADNYARWNKAVISIQGSIQEGNTIELVSVVDPKHTFNLEVTEMSAPTHMVWSDGMPLGLFRGRRTYTITDLDDRSEFTMAEEFSGPLAWLITRAIPDLNDSFNLFADGLKAASEAESDART